MKKLYFLALSVLASASLMATQVKVAAGSDLQAAVDGASSGDTVLVQAGTYEGNFTMEEGVYVSGGWNEDFTAQTEHASILDAKQSGRVLNQPANFATLTIWDNFTIQNGKLTAADGGKNLGAGVALMQKGRVINCLIQNNTFDYSGTCIGGGIGQDVGDRNDTCAINCVVRNNQASHGGGVRIRGVILNSVIEYNKTTTNAAGGMHLQGGAAYNCIIRFNESLKDLGGVRLYGACDLVNCLIVGNKSAGKVGGVQAGEGNAASNIINCTIAGNEQATTGGDAVYCGLRSNNKNATQYNGKFFVNNVVYGNKAGGEILPEQIHEHLRHYATNGKFINNALQGTSAALDTLGTVTYIHLSTENNPQFNEDYSFATTSPLYNAGTNDALTYFVGDKDVYGNARKQGANIEIGAVEIAEPSYEKYSLIATGIKAENETVEGMSVIKLKGEGYLNGEEAVPFEFMVFESMMGYGAEGTIGDIYAFSTEAEFIAEEGDFLLMATMQDEEGKYLFNVEVRGTMPKAEVEIVVKETKDVTLYNLNMNVQGNMAMVTAEGETLSFWLTLLETENYYGTYTNDAFSNIWYGDDQLYAAYGEAQVYAEVDGKAKFVVSFISTPDAEGNVTLYNFTLYAGEKTATGVENLDATIAPVKMLRDGQLVIMKGDTKYNAQGAVVK